MGERGSPIGTSGIKNGQGIQMAICGKNRNFWLDSGGKLRDLERTTALPGDGKSLSKKLIKQGALILSKNQVEAIRQKRIDDRANTPDYETGNPFCERGKGKLVYRPGRQKR